MVTAGFEPAKRDAPDLKSGPFDQARERYLAVSAGLEPARAEPNRFQVYLLNHSDTTPI